MEAPNDTSVDASLYDVYLLSEQSKRREEIRAMRRDTPVALAQGIEELDGQYGKLLDAQYLGFDLQDAEVQYLGDTAMDLLAQRHRPATLLAVAARAPGPTGRLDAIPLLIGVLAAHGTSDIEVAISAIRSVAKILIAAPDPALLSPRERGLVHEALSGLRLATVAGVETPILSARHEAAQELMVLDPRFRE